MKTGDIVFNIGSNVGEVLFNLAKRVGDDGFVYGFEPHPRTYAKLLHNFKLNDFHNCTICNFGFGWMNGQFDIMMPDVRDLGTARIRSQMDDDDTPSSVVKLTTLDNYCRQNSLKKIDLIKIDAEGYEYNILLGGAETLKAFRPKLFIELNDRHLKRQGASPDKLIKYLLALDYNIFRVGDDFRITDSTEFEDCHWDILCLPR